MSEERPREADEQPPPEGAEDAEQGSHGDEETPEEFARDVESDPSRKPDDPRFEQLRGG